MATKKLFCAWATAFFIACSAFAQTSGEIGTKEETIYDKIDKILEDVVTENYIKIAQFVVNSIGGIFYGKECQTAAQLQTTDCAILGILSGADVGTDIFRKQVLESLNTIIKTLDQIQSSINKIENDLENVLKTLALLDISIQRNAVLGGPNGILESTRAAMDRFKALKTQTGQDRYLNWAVDTLDVNTPANSLKNKIDLLVVQLTGGGGQQKGPFALYGDAVVLKYLAFKVQAFGVIRKSPNSLQSYYYGLQSYTSSWLLALQKVANAYDLAAAFVMEACARKNQRCDIRDKLAFANRAEFNSYLKAQKRRILDEFNRQLESIVIRVHQGQNAVNNPNVTQRSDEAVGAVDLMFGYADYFTSTFLDEWGLRGRIITAGDRFSATDASKNEVKGGVFLASSTGGTPILIEPPETSSGQALDITPSAGQTDYWTSSANNGVFDRLYFGDWAVYRYYIPLSADAGTCNLQVPNEPFTDPCLSLASDQCSAEPLCAIER